MGDPLLPVVCRRGLIDRIWPLLYGQVTARERRKGNPDGPSRLMSVSAAGHAAVVMWLPTWLHEAVARADRRDGDGFTAPAYIAAFGHEGLLPFRGPGRSIVCAVGAGLRSSARHS